MRYHHPLAGLVLCLASISVTSSAEDKYFPRCRYTSTRMYPDPDDCQKFFRCVKGKAVPFRCPPLTAFDPDSQVCAWRVRADGCGAKLGADGTGEWKGVLGRLFDSLTQKNTAYMSNVGKRSKEESLTESKSESESESESESKGDKIIDEEGLDGNRNVASVRSPDTDDNVIHERPDVDGKITKKRLEAQGKVVHERSDADSKVIPQKGTDVISKVIREKSGFETKVVHQMPDASNKVIPERYYTDRKNVQKSPETDSKSNQKRPVADRKIIEKSPHTDSKSNQMRPDAESKDIPNNNLHVGSKVIQKRPATESKPIHKKAPNIDVVTIHTSPDDEKERLKATTRSKEDSHTDLKSVIGLENSHGSFQMENENLIEPTSGGLKYASTTANLNGKTTMTEASKRMAPKSKESSTVELSYVRRKSKGIVRKNEKDVPVKKIGKAPVLMNQPKTTQRTISTEENSDNELPLPEDDVRESNERTTLSTTVANISVTATPTTMTTTTTTATTTTTDFAKTSKGNVDPSDKASSDGDQSISPQNIGAADSAVKGDKPSLFAKEHVTEKESGSDSDTVQSQQPTNYLGSISTDVRENATAKPQNSPEQTTIQKVDRTKQAEGKIDHDITTNGQDSTPAPISVSNLSPPSNGSDNSESRLLNSTKHSTDMPSVIVHSDNDNANETGKGEKMTEGTNTPTLSPETTTAAAATDNDLPPGIFIEPFRARFPLPERRHRTMSGKGDESLFNKNTKRRQMHRRDEDTTLSPLSQPEFDSSERASRMKNRSGERSSKSEYKNKGHSRKTVKNKRKSRKGHSSESRETLVNEANAPKVRHVRSSEEDRSYYTSRRKRQFSDVNVQGKSRKSHKWRQNYRQDSDILTANLEDELRKVKKTEAEDLPSKVKSGKWYEKYTLTREQKLAARPMHRQKWFHQRYESNRISKRRLEESKAAKKDDEMITNPFKTSIDGIDPRQKVTTKSPLGSIKMAEMKIADVRSQSDSKLVENQNNLITAKNVESTLTNVDGSNATKIQNGSLNLVADSDVANTTDSPLLSDSSRDSLDESASAATVPPTTTTLAMPTTATTPFDKTANADLQGKVISDRLSEYSTYSAGFNIAGPPQVSADAFASLQTNLQPTPYLVEDVVESFECPSSNGLFPDRRNCRIFHHCENWIPYRRECPRGEVFQDEVMTCVPAELVAPCENEGSDETPDAQERPTCHMANGLYRDPASCHHFYECTEGWPIRRECMKGTVFDQQQGKCTWSQVVPGCENLYPFTDDDNRQVFLCPRDGYFRDAERCDVYYLCAGGDSIRMSCNSGTSFDVSLNMCVWSHLVPGCEQGGFRRDGSFQTNFVPSGPTGDDEKRREEDQGAGTQTDAGDFVCPTPNGFFAHPGDCNLYYACSQHTATAMRCPLGSGYDTVSGLCLDASQLPDCAPYMYQVDPVEQALEEKNLVFECPSDHGLYPDPENCSVFIHCFKGKAYRHKCQDGTLYSSDVAACTWAHLVSECQQGVPTSKSAGKREFKDEGQGEEVVGVPYKSYDVSQAGDYFNYDERSLDQYSDFQCDITLDGFHRDNLFCDIFHRCVGGTKYTFTCPDGTFFSLGQNICDFWDTIADCTEDGVRYEAIGSIPEVAPASETHVSRRLPTPSSPFPGQRTEVHVHSVDHPIPNPTLYDQDLDPVPCPETSGLFAHPRNCHQFVFCAKRVPLVLTCPHTLLYNPMTLTCDYAANVRCLRYDVL